MQDPGGRRERPSVSREPPERSGRTTPHLRQVPGGAFHVSPSGCDASEWKARRRVRRCEGKRCLTTDCPGRSAVQQHRGAPSAGVAWCNEQRTHATPTARRIRCSVAPPAHHTNSLVALLRARGAALTSCRRDEGQERRGGEFESLRRRDRRNAPRVLGDSVSGSARGVVTAWERVRDPSP